MRNQEQFLEVVDRDEAERRFHGAIRLAPLGVETIKLEDALGRVLARDVVSPVDVPGFDRSNLDGFAVQAADTYGAHEETPRTLRLLDEVLATAVVPSIEVGQGTAATIATGGMVPRGADAIVMIEHAEVVGDEVVVRKAVTSGAGISFAGTDIAAGETVVRRGELLTSRETGTIAACGVDRIEVWRQPVVAILSTGDEIIAPGQPMRPGMVFDSNAQILADAVRELGATPLSLGIVGDDADSLRDRLRLALDQADVVLLSGGTSKGAGDISYRVVAELSDPGIVVHGVALKPGKPICLAASAGKPVVVLPGFPASAIFTFHEFVAPVIRALGGRPAIERHAVQARMAVKVNSEVGRTEYLLVGLVAADSSNIHAAHTGNTNTGTANTGTANGGEANETALVAYPMGKGSGSVTAFSRADGFVTIGRHDEIIDAGQVVDVQLLGRETRVADLVVIGSHCVGLDFLLGRMQESGFHTKFLAVGSSGGLAAAKAGECDLAGIHLLDPETGRYNVGFLTPEVDLLPGYGRLQGFVHRPGDARFEGATAHDAIARAKGDVQCVMVNRNQGSGTRILIDRLLAGARPRGYALQTRNHNAVAAAVGQGRADWGITLETVARRAGLAFLPLQSEQFDFVVPRSRVERPAVVAFRALLAQPDVRSELAAMGFTVPQ